MHFDDCELSTFDDDMICNAMKIVHGIVSNVLCFTNFFVENNKKIENRLIRNGENKQAERKKTHIQTQRHTHCKHTHRRTLTSTQTLNKRVR